MVSLQCDNICLFLTILILMSQPDSQLPFLPLNRAAVILDSVRARHACWTCSAQQVEARGSPTVHALNVCRSTLEMRRLYGIAADLLIRHRAFQQPTTCACHMEAESWRCHGNGTASQIWRMTTCLQGGVFIWSTQLPASFPHRVSDFVVGDYCYPSVCACMCLSVCWPQPCLYSLEVSIIPWQSNASSCGLCLEWKVRGVVREAMCVGTGTDTHRYGRPIRRGPVSPVSRARRDPQLLLKRTSVFW